MGKTHTISPQPFRFSLAAVLLQRCAESLAPWFPDVEIVEAHLYQGKHNYSK